SETKLILKLINNNIISRNMLKNRAQREGGILKYSQKEQFQINYRYELPSSLQKYIGTYSRSQPYLSKLYDAKLLWDSGLALTKD
ncbi:MAG: hypothetical protein ABEI13_02725, partial [Candidatus Paceibacteria bacterium]